MYKEFILQKYTNHDESRDRSHESFLIFLKYLSPSDRTKLTDYF